MAHFVFSAWPGWSHFRPLCLLATKVASARPITVTILTANVSDIVNKVNTEVLRCSQIEGSWKGDVRVAAVGFPSTDPAETLTVDLLSFEHVWEALVSESAIKCASSGTILSAAPRPSLVMLDGFQFPWLRIIRSFPPSPPVVQWVGQFSGGLLRISGPESMDGMGDLLRTCSDAVSEIDGLTLMLEAKGRVIHTPGMPPMYDWEFVPQNPECTAETFIFSPEVMQSKFIMSADGVVTRRALAYDREPCLSAVSTWISETGDRPTFHLGPLLPFEPGTCDYSQASLNAEMATAPAGVGTRVFQFLDHALTQYGECSVMYICFGTVSWPTNIDHLRILLHSLERESIPFILSHAAFHAHIPDDLGTHFKDSDIGLFTSWSPQQGILAHKASGWFLTHGGANGAMEALSQGVPMICWPFLVDQPSNVAHLVHNLDVAFECIEVRTGERGLKSIYRTGQTPSGTPEAFQAELNEMLIAIKGDVGARKRANARHIRENLALSWKNEGPARKAFEKFLDHYC